MSEYNEAHFLFLPHMNRNMQTKKKISYAKKRRSVNTKYIYKRIEDSPQTHNELQQRPNTVYQSKVCHSFKEIIIISKIAFRLSFHWI